MKYRLQCLTLATTLVAAIGSHSSVAADTLIELTQLPCQFLESESGIDRGYQSVSAGDCKKINDDSGDDRLKTAKALILKPGNYTFRVTNKNVPYALGFWLRGKGLIDRARLPSVAGGGMTIGKTLDYQIELKPGEYLYSCPLNPTPNYSLIVRQ